jgi:hypothetical protein
MISRRRWIFGVVLLVVLCAALPETSPGVLAGSRAHAVPTKTK